MAANSWFGEKPEKDGGIYSCSIYARKKRSEKGGELVAIVFGQSYGQAIARREKVIIGMKSKHLVDEGCRVVAEAKAFINGKSSLQVLLEATQRFERYMYGRKNAKRTNRPGTQASTGSVETGGRDKVS